MIEVRNLTKHFGTTVAVDDLSFDVSPGMVTGFLGPNGAGKSTTMRAIIGLDRPSAGHITVDGRAYVDLPAPLRESGPSSTPERSTAAGGPISTCSAWRRATASPAGASTRSWTWSGSPTWPASGPAGSRSA